MSIIEVIGGVERTYKYDVVDCTTPECPPDKVSRQASPVLSKLTSLGSSVNQHRWPSGCSSGAPIQ